MQKIRTTMTPLVEQEVTDREYADLKSMGLILETTATTRAALIADAVEQSMQREAPTDPTVVLTPEDYKDDDEAQARRDARIGEVDPAGDPIDPDAPDTVAAEDGTEQGDKDDDTEYDPIGDGNSTLADTETKE